MQSNSQSTQQTFLHQNAFITFNFCYQVGVFVSRSSTAWVTIKRVWILSLLQFVLFCFYALNAIWLFCESFIILFGLSFLVGFMGGASFANVYHQIHCTTKLSRTQRELAFNLLNVGYDIAIMLACSTALLLTSRLFTK